ncbi:MAG: hypothetical protein DWQ04_07285 [Chloroflexi bacterium]|nr:MAG: hypothetical protein DWQ04_07285 [Chloroflexota bacterium]
MNKNRVIMYLMLAVVFGAVGLMVFSEDSVGTADMIRLFFSGMAAGAFLANGILHWRGMVAEPGTVS